MKILNENPPNIEAIKNIKEEWDVLLSFLIIVGVILSGGWWGLRAVYVASHPRIYEPMNGEQSVFMLGDPTKNIINLGGIAKLQPSSLLKLGNSYDPTKYITLVRNLFCSIRNTNPPEELAGGIVSVCDVPKDNDIFYFELGKSQKIKDTGRTFTITLRNTKTTFDPFNIEYIFDIIEE